jgi:hypothetical protein
LNKLLEKIRQQKKDLAEKAAHQQHDLDRSLSSSLSCSLNSNQEQTATKSSMKVSSRDCVDAAIPAAATAADAAESTMTSSLLEDDDVSSSLDEEEEATTTLLEEPVKESKKQQQHTAAANKLIRGIMMSSHNVSSLNEHLVDTNRLILNQKIISGNHRRHVAGAGAPTTMTERNTATYSVDLSHASRDPMVAGARELLNKHVS